MIRELGRGGMGVVLEVEDENLGRTVALKLSTHLTQEIARARFLREGQVAARIQHPHVIQVFDTGIENGVPYLTMELVAGRGLDELPPPEDPEALFLKVADALEHLHSQGLVHRDVKPGNILCDGDRVLLTDFGLVHDPDQTALTRTGVTPGTMAFMSPEMLRGDPITAAADWWALGATIFEVVERRLPYDMAEVMAFASGRVKPLPAFRKVPSDSRIARMARAWMAPEPEDRPASVEALRRALKEPATGSSSGAVQHQRVKDVLARPSSSSSLPPPPDRRPVVLGVAALAAVAALGGYLTGPGEAPVPIPPPPTVAAATVAAARFPAVPAALEVLKRPAVTELLQTQDPWRWGRDLSRLPELRALLPLVRDPAALDPLRRVDAELRIQGRPELLRPHLIVDPDRRPLSAASFPEHAPFSPGPERSPSGWRPRTASCTTTSWLRSVGARPPSSSPCRASGRG